MARSSLLLSPTIHRPITGHFPRYSCRRDNPCIYGPDIAVLFRLFLGGAYWIEFSCNPALYIGHRDGITHPWNGSRALGTAEEAFDVTFAQSIIPFSLDPTVILFTTVAAIIGVIAVVGAIFVLVAVFSVFFGRKMS